MGEDEEEPCGEEASVFFRFFRFFVKNRVLRREAQTEPDVVRILTGTTLVPVRTNPEGSVGGSRLLVVTNNSCVSCIVRDAEWSLL